MTKPMQIHASHKTLGMYHHGHSNDLHALCFAAYDVSRRETFDSIAEIWMKEVEMYSTVQGAVKAIIGNKLDLVSVFPCPEHESILLEAGYAYVPSEL